MAQYIGLVPAPADVPGPRATIAPIPTVGPATTADIQSPTVTNRAPSAPLSHPSQSSGPSTSERIKNAAATAGTLARTYGLEAAPAATAAAITGLGWWMHDTNVAGLEALGATGLAVGAGFAAAHGIKHSHPHLFGGAAGLGVALTDVAAATYLGAGPGSITVAAISTALAYAAYVPWLIRHRKDHKEQPSPKTKSGTAPAVGDQTDDGIYLPATAPVPCGPFHDKVIPYEDDPSDDIRVPLRLGWDEYGNRSELVMLYRHTLVAGASDWGKSGIINLIIKKLLKKKHVELYGIDLKPGAPELGPWEPKLKRLARTPEEARELFDELEAKAARQGALLEQQRQQALAVGKPPVRKWIPGDPAAPAGSPEWGHGPTAFVITDELGELIRQDEALRKQEAELRKLDPEFGPPIEVPLPTRYESALAVWRFLGIQFVSATQQPSNRIFGGNTDARGNYGNRISTRAGEAGHSRLVFGEGAKGHGFTPERLIRPGEYYVAAPEFPQEDPPRHRAEFVRDEDIAEDVASYYMAMPPKLPVVSPIRLVKSEPAKQERPVAPAVRFPDGSEVRRSDWLDLYRVFVELCAEQGYATKDDLTARGPYDSRDTVRRACDMWLTRGVQVRKAGRTDQFHLPEVEESADDEEESSL